MELSGRGGGMAGFDIAVVVLVSALAIALHIILFVLIRRWMDRDLALSFAGDDANRRDYMLRCLRRARTEKVKRRDLPAWLEHAAAECPARAEHQPSA